MADGTVGKVNVEIGVDASKLAPGLNAAEQTVRSSAGGMKASAEGATKAVGGINSELNKVGENLKAQTKGFRQVTEAVFGTIAAVTRWLGVLGLVATAVYAVRTAYQALTKPIQDAIDLNKKLTTDLDEAAKRLAFIQSGRVQAEQATNLKASEEAFNAYVDQAGKVVELQLKIQNAGRDGRGVLDANIFNRNQLVEEQKNLEKLFKLYKTQQQITAIQGRELNAETARRQGEGLVDAYKEAQRERERIESDTRELGPVNSATIKANEESNERIIARRMEAVKIEYDERERRELALADRIAQRNRALFGDQQRLQVSIEGLAEAVRSLPRGVR
jgi:hypothetical protein